MAVKNIETFFLDTLLKICIAGVLLISISDVALYPEDKQSLAIDFLILTACTGAYLVRKKYPTISIFMVTLVVLAAMFYQCLAVPPNTTTSLSIILLVGFIHSVMLRGVAMWTMHVLTYVLILAIFLIQFLNPSQRFSMNLNDVVTVAITYSILFFILTYATAVLKEAYDKIFESLRASHEELHQKATEIAAKNDKLVSAQEKLNAVNSHLETIINERTAKIQVQNEILLKYSYTNAHHLRGPVARLLGLASIYRLDSAQNVDFIVRKMEEQANEIDSVVKKINIELESNHSADAPEHPIRISDN
jgi:hypothetical protein